VSIPSWSASPNRARLSLGVTGKCFIASSSCPAFPFGRGSSSSTARHSFPANRVFSLSFPLSFPEASPALIHFFALSIRNQSSHRGGPVDSGCWSPIFWRTNFLFGLAWYLCFGLRQTRRPFMGRNSSKASCPPRLFFSPSPASYSHFFHTFLDSRADESLDRTPSSPLVNCLLRFFFFFFSRHFGSLDVVVLKRASLPLVFALD